MAFVRPVPESVENAHPTIQQVGSSLIKAELSAERWRRGAWATPSVVTRFLHRPAPTARRAFYDNALVSAVIRLSKVIQGALNKRIL